MYGMDMYVQTCQLDILSESEKLCCWSENTPHVAEVISLHSEVHEV